GARTRAGGGRWPLRYKDRGCRVVPAQAAAREARVRRADGLADSEEDVMRRNADVAPRHPDLQEAWVGVDERGTPEPADHGWRQRMREVEKELGRRGRVGVHRAPGNHGRQRRAGERKRREGLREASSRQSDIARPTFPDGAETR